MKEMSRPGVSSIQPTRAYSVAHAKSIDSLIIESLSFVFGVLSHLNFYGSL